jgi:RNA polymerase sigma-70 factor (ECF subfamily)
MSRRFATTRWSVVLAARGADSKGRQAFSTLCEDYWHPIYAFIRREGYGAEEARDLTQGYFLLLLGKTLLHDFRPAEGRFRSFLLASVRHFLSDARDRERAAKRGGGRAPIPLDEAIAEESYRREPHTELTPEEIFERRWAATVIDRAMRRLGEDAGRRGRLEQFERLKEFLTGAGADTYLAASSDLATTEDAVKVAVHRLRRRYGEMLRREVAETVADPAQVDDEIRYLLEVIGRR